MPNVFKCQQDIKNHFPTVSKVRIYPSSDHVHTTVYYEKLNGDTDTVLESRIKEQLPAHIPFAFKPYSDLKSDNVPPVPKLPELIENLALQESSGNKKDFERVLKKAFPNLNPSIEISPTKYGEIVTVNIKFSKKLSNSELKQYTIYTQELAPIGCIVKIIN